MERPLHAYDSLVIGRKLERPHVLDLPEIPPGRTSIRGCETNDGFQLNHVFIFLYTL